ncbi:helix-turn-helix domain-containing protein [Mucilaginibacter sp. UR6-1]|uniref:helix-turn-helix domain-containing protein n=1 Tax=Mucilaginibacter sp. UR6-1 TaxID=1435643 RepID=UPI001E402E3F|nr:helix-turn-helix domain-containing protein [Mucilaginibacter sp. UR6-1]MCC8411258.1 helix-turn-helix domain-containing protein [Mucilaginibacter sp. UR6-1]
MGDIIEIQNPSVSFIFSPHFSIGMLHISGVVIALFLSMLLFTKRGRSGADMVLAFWLFLISVHLFCYYLLASTKYLEYPYFLGLEIAMPLLHGPLLFLYTTLLTGKTISKLYRSLHFIPAIIVYIALSKFFLLPTPQKIYVYENNGIGYLGLLKIVHFAILPSGIAYILTSLYIIQEHRKNISNLVSHIEKINLNWLRYLIFGMCMIWVSILLGNDISTFSLVDVFILFIGYFGIKQVGIFTNKVTPLPVGNLDAPTPGDIKDIPFIANVKYQKSAIGQEFLSEIHSQVTRLMQQEKVFKDPELSLNELAEQLNIHPNTLSQVINTMENKNFYDYINDLRIEEFKLISIQPENQKFTLLAMAYEVGFNSKTSFNRNFKKKIGLSPTAYLKQQKIALQPININM